MPVITVPRKIHSRLEEVVDVSRKSRRGAVLVHKRGRQYNSALLHDANTATILGDILFREKVEGEDSSHRVNFPGFCRAAIRGKQGADIVEQQTLVGTIQELLE